MRIKRLVIFIATVLVLLASPPITDSHYEAETDQLIASISRNFNVIDVELGRRGQRLSPVFLNNVKATRDVFEDLKKEKEKFDGKTVNSADRYNYIDELRVVDVDTSGMALFLETAPSDDNGETKVIFDTVYKGKPNNGWWVCWISYGTSKSKKHIPNCYPQTSTPLPKNAPQPMASGCKYVISIMDPDPKKSVPIFPFKHLGPYIVIPSSDTDYTIPIPVPYKIKT